MTQTVSDSTNYLQRAASLLESVAWDAEGAVDAEVPLRCGVAADQLYSVVGVVQGPLFDVGDHVTTIRRAITEAIALLAAADDPAEVVLDALRHARRALDAIG